MSHVDVIIHCDFTRKYSPNSNNPVFNFGVWGWTQNHAARSGNEIASLPVLILAVTVGATAEYKRDDEVRATDLHLQCCFSSLYRYSSFTLYSSVSWPYK